MHDEPTREDTTRLVVLDVTLRDGGFHNAWDFDAEHVRAYLRAMDEAGVDWAEIGYRSVERTGFFGALRYCEEAWIDALPALRHTRLALMLDAKELADREDEIGRFFAPADRSRVGLVRVATRPRDLSSAIAQVSALAEHGYRTTLNLMAWASVDPADRAPLMRALAASPADVVYLADSYGNMYPEEIADAVRLWNELTDGTERPRPIGVHLHNNLELAFANALAARDAGATWVDAAVLGMGRGPGNLKTEILLQHLETREGLTRYRTAPIYELIGRHWESLHTRYSWGPRAPYVLSGQLAVHPTYAQELLESGRYTISEVIAILHALHDSKQGRSFSRRTLDEAISLRPALMPTPSSPPSPGTRTRFVSDWAGREVIVVGRGPSSTQHVDAINRYIRRHAPIVLECNHLAALATAPEHFACFTLHANAQRMLQDVLHCGKAAILGVGRSEDGALGADDGDARIVVEPYQVASGELSASPCVIPADVVSMFAIMQAVQRGARRVRVVGFDGYRGSPSPRDARMQQELEGFFALLGQRYPEVEVISLTPTSFPIEVRSIYASLALDPPTALTPGAR